MNSSQSQLIEEKKIEQHGLLSQRIPIYQASYLAMRYALTKDIQDTDWKNILNLVVANNTEHSSKVYAIKVDKACEAIKRKYRRLENHDARKLAVLARIYLKAEEYLDENPANLDKKKIIFDDLNYEINYAIKDLLSNLSKDSDKKYGSTTKYLNTIIAIMKATGISSPTLSTNSSDVLELYNQAVKELEEKNRAKAVAIRTNKNTLYSLAKIATTPGDKQLAADETITRRLYLGADFSQYRCSTLLQDINKEASEIDPPKGNEKAKSLLINRIQEIYQPRLLNTIKESLSELGRLNYSFDYDHKAAEERRSLPKILKELEAGIEGIEALQKNNIIDGNNSINYKYSIKIFSGRYY